MGRSQTTDDLPPTRPRSSVGIVLATTRGRANSGPPVMDTSRLKPGDEDKLFQAIGRLTRDSGDDLDKDQLYNSALAVARKDGLKAGLAWASTQVPVVPKVAADFTEVVFDTDRNKFDAMRQAFGNDRRIEALHGTFGGKTGLPVVKRILADVCGNDVARLKQFLDAVDKY